MCSPARPQYQAVHSMWWTANLILLRFVLLSLLCFRTHCGGLPASGLWTASVRPLCPRLAIRYHTSASTSSSPTPRGLTPREIPRPPTSSFSALRRRLFVTSATNCLHRPPHPTHPIRIFFSRKQPYSPSFLPHHSPFCHPSSTSLLFFLLASASASSSSPVFSRFDSPSDHPPRFATTLFDLPRPLRSSLASRQPRPLRSSDFTTQPSTEPTLFEPTLFDLPNLDLNLDLAPALPPSHTVGRICWRHCGGVWDSALSDAFFSALGPTQPRRMRPGRGSVPRGLSPPAFASSLALSPCGSRITALTCVHVICPTPCGPACTCVDFPKQVNTFDL